MLLIVFYCKSTPGHDLSFLNQIGKKGIARLVHIAVSPFKIPGIPRIRNTSFLPGKGQKFVNLFGLCLRQRRVSYCGCSCRPSRSNSHIRHNLFYGILSRPLAITADAKPRQNLLCAMMRHISNFFRTGRRRFDMKLLSQS